MQNQMPKWEEARNQKAQTTPLTYQHPGIQPQNFPPHRHHEIMNEDWYNLTRRRADLNTARQYVPRWATAPYTNEEIMFRAALLEIRSEGHQ